MTSDFRALIREGASARGLHLPERAIDGLARYLELLAFWNRRINLTSFDLTGITSQAVTRLVLEPSEAARLVRPVDRTGVDIGSGGGSPAIPLMVCCPWLRLTMVEVRARKSAFLREALRELELEGRVEQARVEELHLAPVSLVTMRAVRPDGTIWAAIERLLSPDGRFFWFGAPADISTGGNLELVETHDSITILARTSA